MAFRETLRLRGAAGAEPVNRAMRLESVSRLSRFNPDFLYELSAATF